MDKATIKEGDMVEVYGLIGCEDYMGKGKVYRVASIPSCKVPLVWIEGFSGGWHPDALKKIAEILSKEKQVKLSNGTKTK